MKSRSKLIYSADYDRESGTVKTRDWREDHEKVQGKEGRRSILS
jgi:hypothetical protein